MCVISYDFLLWSLCGCKCLATTSRFPDCFTHMSNTLKPPKKSSELKKKLSWLFSGKKQQRVEDTAEEDGMPRWICMVMTENDQESCKDILSRSLDLDLLRQHSNGSYATGEELESSPTDQVSSPSKSSMLMPFRHRSRSVSPENLLGVRKLTMARRRFESTTHRLDVERKGPVSHKSSVLSDTSTGAHRRCSQASDVSMLSPLSPVPATKGDFDLKVCVYVK